MAKTTSCSGTEWIVKFDFASTLKIGQDSAGQCIPVKCDHGNDDEVQQLFDKVSREQNGRLDVLVNNAYKGVKVNTVM